MLLCQVVVVRVTCGNKIRDIPNDFEKAEFETITAFCSYAEIRKYKKACIFIAIFCVFEMVE